MIHPDVTESVYIGTVIFTVLFFAQKNRSLCNRLRARKKVKMTHMNSIGSAWYNFI